MLVTFLVPISDLRLGVTWGLSAPAGKPRCSATCTHLPCSHPKLSDPCATVCTLTAVLQLGVTGWGAKGSHPEPCFLLGWGTDPSCPVCSLASGAGSVSCIPEGWLEVRVKKGFLTVIPQPRVPAAGTEERHQQCQGHSGPSLQDDSPGLFSGLCTLENGRCGWPWRRGEPPGGRRSSPESHADCSLLSSPGSWPLWPSEVC